MEPHGAAIVGIVAVPNQGAVAGLALKRLRAVLRTGYSHDQAWCSLRHWRREQQQYADHENNCS